MWSFLSSSASLTKLATEWLKQEGGSSGERTSLTEAEHKLLISVRNPPDLTSQRVGLTDEKLRTFVEGGASHSQEDVIRAKLVRWLCSDRAAKELVDPGGIYIADGRVEGAAADTYRRGGINLCSLKIPFPLILHGCCLPQWFLLLGAEIPFLDLTGSHVGSIAADVLKIRGDMYLRDGFSSDGILKLPGASIGGDFDASGARLTHAEPSTDLPGPSERYIAINAEGIHVAGDVLMTFWSTGKRRAKFCATGRVCLDGAEVGGDVKCDGGEFLNPAHSTKDESGDALTLRGSTIRGYVYMRAGFHAKGAVRLPGATIGQSVECGGGKFENVWEKDNRRSGVALELDGAEIKLDLNLSEYRTTSTQAEPGVVSGESPGCGDARTIFEASGTVSLTGTRINRSLHLKRGQFQQAVPQRDHPYPQWRPALDLTNTVTDYLCYPSTFEDGKFAKGQLTLDGFVYGRISTGAKDKNIGLKWIALQYEDGDSAKFTPQPYLQLAQVLRQEGDDGGAKDVLEAMEDRRHKSKSALESGWGFILKGVIGYGYRSGRAFLWLLGIWLIGFVLFWAGYCQGGMEPTDTAACKIFVEQNRRIKPDGYVAFHASLYSLENAFPAVRLGQSDKWVPVGGWQVLRVIELMLGWFLFTLFVAGFSGLTRKN
jgi:hypothetical protein